MYPIYHFVFTVVLSGFLWPILGWKLALFWLGSFFIDVDHYWWYIIKFKDFSLRKAYIYSKDCVNSNELRLHIFHTVEFWILVGIWGLFSEFGFAIMLGVFFHIFLDFVYRKSKKFKSTRASSFFGWYFN